MIIVSITGPDMKGALSQLKSSSRYADIVEFRLDLIRNARLERLMAATRKPVIITCRPRWEGGAFSGREEVRLRLLSHALELGAEYVDIELRSSRSSLEQLINSRRDGVVVSVHYHERRAIDVDSLYDRMHATGAAVLKFAYTALDAHDIRHAVRFLERARQDRRKAVAIAMGEAGEASRIVYRTLGGWATYGAPGQGKLAAPGQVSVRELRELYRAHRLTSRTKVFGVIGNPVRQSKGIVVHNTLFAHDGVNAVYVRFPVANLRAFMQHGAPVMHGFSVTVPHKERVMKFLDHIDPTARKIGAVNTVVRRNRGWYGTNTDAAGALDAIEHRLRVRSRSVMVIGAGGAARAIAYEAQRRGASVTIANRTEARGRKLARSLDIAAIRLADIPAHRFDIMINATPVGMIPDTRRTPLPDRWVHASVVFDAVYNPPMTRFLHDARKNRARIISGTEMYINQAALQYQLFAGRNPDLKEMKRALGGPRPKAHRRKR
jgi:3-dehydroquinate dehydratase/shikimate dehydrogenase